MKTTTGDAFDLTLRFVQVFTKGNEYEMVGGNYQPPILKTIHVPAGATTRTVSFTNVDLSLFWRNDCMSSVYNPRIKLTITPSIQGASSTPVYINDNTSCPVG